MDFPIYTCIDIKGMKFSGVVGPIFLNGVFLFLKSVSILAISAGPDGIFYLGLHCLIKYLFIGIQSEEG